MVLLFLYGYQKPPLLDWLQNEGNIVIPYTEPLTAEVLQRYNPDLVISFGYRHIISKEVLESYPHQMINLHIAYLPWNRGSKPNFWSIWDGTPNGVTVHLIDEGMDTGDILYQEQMTFDDTITLQQSYDSLQTAIQALFRTHWQEIRQGCATATAQGGQGTVHYERDFTALSNEVPIRWDLSIGEVRALKTTLQ